MDQPTLVLIPSLGTTTRIWQGAVAELRRRLPAVRIVLTDLPGHGAGEPANGPFTIEEIADRLAGRLRAGALERPVCVAGVSMGGAVALAMARRHPDLVASIALFSSAATFGDADAWEPLTERVRAGGTAALRESSRAGWFAPGFAESHAAEVDELLDDLAAIDAASYLECCAALAAFDAGSWLTQLDQPALVVAGADDTAPSPDAVRGTAGRLPASRFEILSPAGHLAVVELPDRTAALLEALISPGSQPTPRSRPGTDARRDFPADFLWGAATAAHQVEGANVNSDWWRFEHDPSTAAKESSGDGIDHWSRYADDFALLRSLGHTAHRLSVEWARIEPSEGEFSDAALAHYRRVLTELRRHGMRSFVTLHHFTLPLWFAARGGWLAPDALAVFERYCGRVLKELGDLIDYVCTINEPQMVALHGYLEGYHPPGVTNALLWKRVGRVLLDAHHRAVEVTRLHSDAAPGLVVQLPLLAPARDDEVTRAFCHELTAEIVDLHLDGLRGDAAGDWLGVQYYRKNWVDPASPTLFAAPPPDMATTQMGWAVHPDGLRIMLHRAARAGLPLFVTENGIATEDDAERVAYLEQHLVAVRQAREEGVDVRGYLHWSAFDNFEWSEGYGPKFGLIAVDRADGFRRAPKPSAFGFAAVARTGRIAALRPAARSAHHHSPTKEHE